MVMIDHYLLDMKSLQVRLSKWMAKCLKEYFGSASEFQKGERKNVEGKKIVVPYKVL